MAVPQEKQEIFVLSTSLMRKGEDFLRPFFLNNFIEKMNRKKKYGGYRLRKEVAMPRKPA